MRFDFLPCGAAVACLLLSAAAPAPRPVRVQTVTLTPSHFPLAASGTVQARTQADLAFRVGGKVVLRPVEIGDHVHAGQLLAQLDAADLQFSEQASDAALRAAQAELANARIDLQRYQQLGRRSPAFLPSEYDKRLSAERSAEARAAQATRQLGLARDQRVYGALTADAQGIVTALAVQVGQVVASGQTVATIAHTASIEVVADVPENRLSEVRPGQDVTVTLWAFPDTTLHGQVREIGALADAASRTFAVKVTLQDASRVAIAFGMTATVQFEAATSLVTVLPASALTDRDGVPAVWILDPATASALLRPVTLGGYAADGSLLVHAGLAPGEQVITAGVGQLEPGMKLTAWAGASR